MPFIPLPVYVVDATEEEIEQKENLKQEIPATESIMYVNTTHITDFCEQENGHVLIFLSNGRAYTVIMDLDDFLDALAASEAIIDLSNIGDN